MMLTHLIVELAWDHTSGCGAHTVKPGAHPALYFLLPLVHPHAGSYSLAGGEYCFRAICMILGVLPILHLGVTSGCAWENIWDAGDRTGIDCPKQMPYPSTIVPVLGVTFFELHNLGWRAHEGSLWFTHTDSRSYTSWPYISF